MTWEKMIVLRSEYEKGKLTGSRNIKVWTCIRCRNYYKI